MNSNPEDYANDNLDMNQQFEGGVQGTKRLPFPTNPGLGELELMDNPIEFKTTLIEHHKWSEEDAQNAVVMVHRFLKTVDRIMEEEDEDAVGDKTLHHTKEEMAKTYRGALYLVKLNVLPETMERVVRGNFHYECSLEPILWPDESVWNLQSAWDGLPDSDTIIDCIEDYKKQILDKRERLDQAVMAVL